MVAKVIKKDFEQVPHTADIKIRVYGKTLEQFFCNALIGMFQVIGPKAKGCTVVNGRLVCSELPEKHTLVVTAPDRNALLVDFLSEALYLSDVHNEAYLAADVNQLSETEISATVYGIKVTGFEVVEIKAVTYHDLDIQQKDGVWVSDIVFDI